MKNQSYSVNSIGVIKNSMEATYIKIDKKYRESLIGLEGFNYLQVLFWFHLADNKENRTIFTVDKPYKNSPETLGTFATRSQFRPNPIGLTPVMILSIDINRGIIQIPFIDAEDGTPILDIKPYTTALDRVKNVSSPDWCSHWPKWYEESADFDWEDEFNF